ncbi:D-aminoacyl-tRNA deacylase [Petrachloros mirabilis]
MKAVIQRVTRASVEVDGQVVGKIGEGLLVLLGVAKADGEPDGRFIVEKLRTLRIFSDEAGRMNRSLTEMGGSILLVSQFTLLGNTRNGRRPSFDEAAAPDEAKHWYEWVQTMLKAQGTHVETGVFAAHMKVDLLNDGPVTFCLDSRSGVLASP